MSRVIPGCRAVIVIHKEGPPSLRVNFDFPAEGERVVVIVGHCHYRRLCLHAPMVAAEEDDDDVPDLVENFDEASKDEAN